MINRYSYWAIILLAGLVACKQQRQPCLTPDTVALNMKTVQLKNDTLVADTATPYPVFIALTSSGMATSIPGSRASFSLYLSPVADSCTWLFMPDTTVADIDTFIFRYTRELHFISNACGYTYYYNIRSVQHTNYYIDSLKITDANVTSNVNVSHLEVFIHPHP